MENIDTNTTKVEIKANMPNTATAELRHTNNAGQVVFNMQTFDVCLKVIEIGLKIFEIYT